MDEEPGFSYVLTQVDWFSETRLLAVLLSLYTTCTALTFITWKRINLQALYFLFLCCCVYWAETLNKFLAKNWKFFSTEHQYFDANGLFISVVYSTPLLLNLLVLLFHWLRSAATDLIVVKRREVKQRMVEPDKKND